MVVLQLVLLYLDTLEVNGSQHYTHNCQHIPYTSMTSTDPFAKDFIEPDIPWADSAARGLLYDDIIEKRVALTADGSATAREIYNQRPEYKLYAWKQFPSRLTALRNFIGTRRKRAAEDREAFDRYAENHSKSKLNQRGEPHFDKSAAQVQLRKDMDEGMLDQMTRRQLYEMESRNNLYQMWPFSVFSKCIEQELRLRKYHTFIKNKDDKDKKQRMESHLKRKRKQQKLADKVQKIADEAKRDEHST